MTANLGDARGAAALFSNYGTYKDLVHGPCSNTCTDRSEIQAACGKDLRPNAPYGVTIEQVCGDTMAVVTLPAARAASNPEASVWNVAVFGVSAGQISSYQGALRPEGLSLSEARAAAADVCAGVKRLVRSIKGHRSRSAEA